MECRAGIPQRIQNGLIGTIAQLDAGSNHRDDDGAGRFALLDSLGGFNDAVEKVRTAALRRQRKLALAA